MIPDWTPYAAAVEREAKAIHDVAWPAAEWDATGGAEMAMLTIARRNLRVQHEREAPLVAKIRRAIGVFKYYAAPERGEARLHLDGQFGVIDELETVLAAHAALDAPPAPEPTLAEAVEAMLRSAPGVIFGHSPKSLVPLDADGTRLAVVRPVALAAVEAALARHQGVKP